MCQKDQEELLNLERKYDKILSSDPKSNTFSQLADVLCKLGKVDKAMGVLIKGLSHNKNNVTARFLLGKIYYDRWLIEQAKKEMEKVLELTPDNTEASILLSEIYKSEDKVEKALSTLESAHVFHTDDNELKNKISEIKDLISEKAQKQSSQAFETPIESRKINEVKLDDSIADTEVYTETMFNLYLEQGEYQKATEIIDRVYCDQDQRNLAIEKVKKTKLNKMNKLAGFNSKE